ncbi:MAG: DUF4835 family protein [Chlorobi bacterium]|nr:DUF4835 family protein [Chlorobiota bacterium]
MKFKSFSLFLLILFSLTARTQEINAEVRVEAPPGLAANRQIFITLENSIREFLNTRKWTRHTFLPHERIRATFMLVVREYKDNRIKCELNISAFRPVYNSTYESPLLTVSDKKVEFNYVQYQPLEFNPEILDNNLTAVLAFYVYMILGYDFDSFKEFGGTEYFKTAKEIQVNAAGQGLPGWENKGGFFSRAEWVDQLLLNENQPFHRAMYSYHRLGLDLMASNPRKGKEGVIRAIRMLHMLTPQNADVIIKIFFDTKADEIFRILSGGPEVPSQKNIKQILIKLAPMYRMKWEGLP